MKFRNFLPRIFHIASISLLFVCLAWDAFIIFFILFAIYILALFLFRENQHDVWEDSNLVKEFIFSPVFGEVLSIRKNILIDDIVGEFHEIRMRIPWWTKWGLYLPSNIEVLQLLVKKGKSYYRFSKKNSPSHNDHSHLAVSLKGENKDLIVFRLLKCLWGGWPKIWLIPGDKGKSKANFGYIPFGGTVLFYISSKYEPLIETGQQVLGSQTVIAKLES